MSYNYAARWPDETPPTLAECVSFCESVIPDEPVPESIATPMPTLDASGNLSQFAK